MKSFSELRNQFRQKTLEWKKKGWVEQAYWAMKLALIMGSASYVISGAVLVMGFLLILLKRTGPIDTLYVNYLVCIVIILSYINFMAGWTLRLSRRIDPFKKKPEA